jgi:hypothetical protein
MANNESIQNLVNLVRTFDDIKSTSLPQYTKKSRIDSAIYIQKEISDNAIVGDVVKTMLDLYTGYILSALELNTYISDTTTIRDYIETVATEDFHYIDENNIKSDFSASFNTSRMNRKYITNKYSRNSIMLDLDDIPKTTDRNNSNQNISMAGPIEYRVDKPFPNGRILSVRVSSPHDSSVTFTVPLHITLTPRIIANEVAEQFLSLNLSRDLQTRWMMMKAKEITFFKDFLFQMDLLKKRREALKRDRGGDLQTMLASTKNAIANQWMKLLRIKPNKQNIANTIAIYDKQTFDRTTNHLGFNFDRYKDRQVYFEKSYSMAIVTIDQNYSIVETFFNGIEHKGEYTFNQLMAASKKDTLNLMAVMSQMSQNRPVTF